jgi:hypothetical protein
MKSKNRGTKMLILSALLAGTVAYGQTENVRIKINDIQIEDSVYTPHYNVDTEQDHEQGAAARWVRVGVYFTTEGGWIDELEITQMATKKAEEGDPGIVLISTEHYINLNPGDHYVYVYLHPSYVKRYDIDAFDLDSAAIIKVGNTEVARKESTKNAKEGWSKHTDPSMKKGYLLNHAETPFWFINYDFKEIIRKNEASR